jgi:hypothetical protein
MEQFLRAVLDEQQGRDDAEQPEELRLVFAESGHGIPSVDRAPC